VIGVVLLIVDALRERSRGGESEAPAEAEAEEPEFAEDYPEEAPVAQDDESDAETTGVIKEGEDEDSNSR
jgi:hypothetical protein